jgi:hypothetical protein
MCIVSDKIKFCTCEVVSYDELPHYWLLYRFNKNKLWIVEGSADMPIGYLIDSQYARNLETFIKRLNEPDAFDKPIKFKSKDRIEIVLNNLSENENDRMTFCFEYRKGAWLDNPYDGFELMNEYDEVEFGNFSQLENE